MAQQHEILSDKTTQTNRVKDVYTDGRDALQEDFKKNSRKLNRMRPSTCLLYRTPAGPLEDEVPIDDEEEDLRMECLLLSAASPARKLYFL
ncbi:hypothetical protein PSHT_11542 [Puccinia striiformis]|uniref:Uncharacterized protein n=1 Tax=Puccinia striiformis TaxID=27350 RepID=A0A2S4V2L2_9BASI|nr:hypothetical protein PSHT_11542 [Puccinia striiformis]